MATREATAIREEAAQVRIAKASELLAKNLNVEFKPISVTDRDPYARQANLAEQVADLLEKIVDATNLPFSDAQEGQGEDENAFLLDGEDEDAQAVPGPVGEAEGDDAEGDVNDASNNAGSGSDRATRATQKPIRRSETIRDRR